MNLRALAPALAAALVLTGCDKIPFIGGGSDTAATDSAAVADSAAAAAAAAEIMTPDPGTDPGETAGRPEGASEAATAQQPSQPTPPPARAAPARTAPQQTLSFAGEEPWTPTHTGLVRPGMTQQEVIDTWGAPEAERASGNWTFLYFRNGCEIRCGTFDVVFLQGGQVVDAVVRGPGHDYAGVSSSPPDRAAMFTPPTQTTPDTLGVIG